MCRIFARATHDERLVFVVDLYERAARVRLFDTGQINKNDDNDVRSVAVTAPRVRDRPELVAEDQTMVLRVWARRRRPISRCH